MPAVRRHAGVYHHAGRFPPEVLRNDADRPPPVVHTARLP